MCFCFFVAQLLNGALRLETSHEQLKRQNDVVY